MGNASQICCQHNKNIQPLPHSADKKWSFQFTESPHVTELKILQRLKQLQSKPLKIAEQNHAGAKQQPPMKQAHKQFVYVGSWLNDLPQGYGKIYFKNNQYFQGQFSEGIANGVGRYFFEDGSYFEGTIKQNQAFGNGKYINSQFEFYGQWNDSKAQNGIFKFTNNTQIVLNNPNSGSIKWSDGRVYSGQIKDLNPHGKGRIQFSNNSVYQGIFEQGIMNGQGQYVYPDKTKYVGNFKNGLKHGIGKIFYKNGVIYQGEWKNGKQDGLGKLIKDDKILYEGYFKNSVPITKQQYFSEQIQNNYPNMLVSNSKIHLNIQNEYNIVEKKEQKNKEKQLQGKNSQEIIQRNHESI